MVDKAFQQGDCLLKLRNELPVGARLVSAGVRGFVLAEGEHTGHAHVIEASPGIELYEKDGVLWLKVDQEASLVHEEHHAQTITPGVYEVSRVVEVDPFENEVRAVQD